MVEVIEFWTNPQSRGLIVAWMLAEIGQPVRQIELVYGEAMKSPDYLAVNPMGKVPAIRWQGQVVTEAAAICAFLAETFPEAGLAPLPEERGAWFRWLFFGAGPLEAAITNRAMGFEAPGRQATLGYGSYDDVVRVLEGAVEGGGWFCGARFTAADVYTGSQIFWGLRFGNLPERPAFLAYVERLKARPAFRAAMAALL